MHRVRARPGISRIARSGTVAGHGDGQCHGGGLTQKKWSASGRYQSGTLYGLAEYAHTQELESGRDAFAFSRMLAEGVRLGFGMMMNRMGRYGAALPKAQMDMGDMEGMDMMQ